MALQGGPPVLQQPGAGVTAPGCPPGLLHLATLDQFCIKQKKEWGEIMTGGKIRIVRLQMEYLLSVYLDKAGSLTTNTRFTTLKVRRFSTPRRIQTSACGSAAAPPGSSRCTSRTPRPDMFDNIRNGENSYLERVIFIVGSASI